MSNSEDEQELHVLSEDIKTAILQGRSGITAHPMEKTVWSPCVISGALFSPTLKKGWKKVVVLLQFHNRTHSVLLKRRKWAIKHSRNQAGQQKYLQPKMYIKEYN